MQILLHRMCQGRTFREERLPSRQPENDHHRNHLREPYPFRGKYPAARQWCPSDGCRRSSCREQRNSHAPDKGLQPCSYYSPASLAGRVGALADPRNPISSTRASGEKTRPVTKPQTFLGPQGEKTRPMTKPNSPSLHTLSDAQVCLCKRGRQLPWRNRKPSCSLWRPILSSVV